LAAATFVARRICDLIQKDVEHPALSVSVGAASYPKDAQTIGTLLYAADRALYEMKPKPQRSAQIISNPALNLYDKDGKVPHG
jgi:GGDEF domain-containing protein